MQVFLDQQHQFRSQLNSLMGQTPWTMLNDLTERNLDTVELQMQPKVRRRCRRPKRASAKAEAKRKRSILALPTAPLDRVAVWPLSAAAAIDRHSLAPFDDPRNFKPHDAARRPRHRRHRWSGHGDLPPPGRSRAARSSPPTSRRRTRDRTRFRRELADLGERVRLRAARRQRSSSPARPALRASIDEARPVDILVNAAGITRDATLRKMTTAAMAT